MLASEALETADASAASIECVDFLERIHYEKVGATMVAMVKKLAPGGSMTATVPDLKWVAERYIDGVPVDVQKLTTNACNFDDEALPELLAASGLERIGRVPCDRAGYLSFVGFKPSAPMIPKRTFAIMSMPRYGPTRHFQCANRAFYGIIPYEARVGAFWHQLLSDGIERVMREHDPEFIITCDYDTAFTRQDVFELYRLMQTYPDADAIAPIQAMRGKDQALFGIQNADGTYTTQLYKASFQKNLTKITVAHFGLTIFRASKLKALPRPWMIPMPAGDGQWNEGDPANGIHGKTDADIVFWQNWIKAGHTLFLANHVQVGHLEECVRWMDRDLKPFFQDIGDYNDNGIPAEAMR